MILKEKQQRRQGKTLGRCQGWGMGGGEEKRERESTMTFKLGSNRAGRFSNRGQRVVVWWEWGFREGLRKPNLQQSKLKLWPGSQRKRTTKKERESYVFLNNWGIRQAAEQRPGKWMLLFLNNDS